jgi:hypothetical protein
MATAVQGTKSDAPTNKRANRCPSWRQLYRITATLCEVAGVEAPHTALEASALIERLDALQSDAPMPVQVDAVGADCPF